MTYLFKSRFSTVTFFICYLLACFLKVTIVVIIWLWTMFKKVLCKTDKSTSYDVDAEMRKRINKQYQYEGAMLYTALPIGYLTGVYRMMGAKNFSREIGIGFSLDIVFTLIMLFL